MPVKKM
jgi:hypothetical protein